MEGVYLHDSSTNLIFISINEMQTSTRNSNMQTAHIHPSLPFLNSNPPWQKVPVACQCSGRAKPSRPTGVDNCHEHCHEKDSDSGLKNLLSHRLWELKSNILTVSRIPYKSFIFWEVSYTNSCPFKCRIISQPNPNPPLSKATAPFPKVDQLVVLNWPRPNLCKRCVLLGWNYPLVFCVYIYIYTCAITDIQWSCILLCFKFQMGFVCIYIHIYMYVYRRIYYTYVMSLCRSMNAYDPPSPVTVKSWCWPIRVTKPSTWRLQRKPHRHFPPHDCWLMIEFPVVHRHVFSIWRGWRKQKHQITSVSRQHSYFAVERFDCQSQIEFQHWKSTDYANSTCYLLAAQQNFRAWKSQTWRPARNICELTLAFVETPSDPKILKTSHIPRSQIFDLPNLLPYSWFSRKLPSKFKKETKTIWRNVHSNFFRPNHELIWGRGTNYNNSKPVSTFEFLELQKKFRLKSLVSPAFAGKLMVTLIPSCQIW